MPPPSPLRPPPFARLPPLRAALPRRYAGPSLRFASLGGWPPPLRPRPRRWRGVARPAPGAGHSSPRRHACGVHGWAPGGTRSLALARLRLGRCPRREDRRGSSRRSAALFRPAGFGWGRARRCGTRQPAASPTPPPIRAQATPSLTRVVQIRRDGGFPTPLVRPRLFRPFLGSFWRFGGYKCPPRLHFTKKRPQKALQGRLQLAPSVPLRVKLGATCLTAAYLPGADSGPRPAPSRQRGARRDWGQAFGLPRHGLSIL